MLIVKILDLQKQIQDLGGKIEGVPMKSELENATEKDLESWVEMLEKELAGLKIQQESSKVATPPAAPAVLTESQKSQKRLIAADDKYLWKVLTIPRDKIVKEENWQELAEDCKEAFSLLQSSDESLTPELLELKKRLRKKEDALNSNLAYWRKQADSEEIEYPKIPLEEMKPWEKFSQIGFIKYQIKNKKKEEKKMETHQQQQTTQQQPGQQVKPEQEKPFSELFAPIVDKLDKVVSSIGANTERVGKLSDTVEKLVGVVEESTKELRAQQTRSSGSGATATAAQLQPSSQQVTADSLAEALRQRGIVGTPPTAPIVDSTRRGDGSGYRQEHPWLRTLAVLLGIVMILGLIGTVIALVWAAANSGQIGAVDKKAEFAISQANEAKSLAQSAQASANQALAENERQFAQIAALQEQFEQYKRQINEQISSIDSRLMKIERGYATKEDLVVINNQLIKLGEELDRLRGVAITKTEFQSEVRRIESWIGNAVVALIGTWVFDNLVRSRLCVGVCAERYGHAQPQPPPTYTPPTYTPPSPAPVNCGQNLTRTNQGTYLVGLEKVWETTDQIGLKLQSSATCFGPIVLVHFDSVYPNQGRQVNQNGVCWVEGDIVICQKIPGFRLRNIKTTFNGVETWGNVPGGSIP